MKRAIRVLPVIVAVAVLSSTALAEETEVILRGKVTMLDGTPPPKSVGMERICSDRQGNKPGPLTNSKGEYLWRLMVDPMRSRQCFIHATLAGYTSSEINISALNGYTTRTQEMETLVLRPADSANPRMINGTEVGVPGKAKNDWKAAMAALEAGDTNAVVLPRLQAAVAAEPKFARGWHTLGIVLENLQKPAEARAAYQKANEADPKMLEPYVTLGELAIKAAEWQKAIDLSQALIKLDKKRVYPDAYVYTAIAQFELKNLAAAEASAAEAMNPKETKALRGEYVLGRILAAKGDLAGAKQHIERYLELKPDARDAAEIKASLATLGQVGAKQPDLLQP